MSDTTTSKAHNLARIRDNQRRSRARRKEYLQELETKLRNCEQMGIEASSEIQSAARKVLEENRKLRALLREKGVPEDDIMAVMNSDRNYEYGSAAPMLNAMLERKRTCNSQISSSNVRCATPQTTASLPYASAPIPIAPQRAVTLSQRNGSASPHSMGSSSVDTPSSYPTPSFSQVPVSTAREYQDVESVPQLNFQYDQSLQQAWAYSQGPNYDSTYVAEPVSYGNTSSCVYAANIIRTMRNDVGLELEADLGCREYGQDCTVENHTVFNVMDKYSNQDSGM